MYTYFVKIHITFSVQFELTVLRVDKRKRYELLLLLWHYNLRTIWTENKVLRQLPPSFARSCQFYIPSAYGSLCT